MLTYLANCWRDLEEINKVLPSIVPFAECNFPIYELL